MSDGSELDDDQLIINTHFFKHSPARHTLATDTLLRAKIEHYLIFDPVDVTQIQQK